jgi:hypothetical protein
VLSPALSGTELPGSARVVTVVFKAFRNKARLLATAPFDYTNEENS